MEGFQAVELFANPDKLDRLADNRLNRQGRAAPGVAIQLGENDALDADSLVEGRCHVYGFLPGHGIDDEKRVSRPGGFLDRLEFLHQGLIDL